MEAVVGIRTGIAAAMLVVIAALPAPMPAAAATAACPDIIQQAGFFDLRTLPVEMVDAVDCIAHYGITAGTGPSTYSPAGVVPRWQMALFLVRTAERLNVPLPADTTSEFTDVTGLDPAAQQAIARLARLGLTSGTSATTFSPFDPVARWQMAVFLTRLLARAGVALPDGSSQGFGDLAGLSPEAVKAVNQITQLGIARGTAPGTFSPGTPVTRGDMAVFLARSLQAGGARPLRLAIASSASSAPAFGSVVVTATVLRPDGRPFPGVLVDIFVTQGLAADGTCALDVDAILNAVDAGSSQDCRIDRADPLTNSEGRVTVGLAHSGTAETDIVLAWVGSEGQVFDADLVTDRASTSVTWAPAATGLFLTPGQVRPFGTTATVVAQLSGTGSSVAGQTIRFQVTRNGVPLLSQQATTAAGGAAALLLSGPADPGAGDDPSVSDAVVAFWDRNGNGIDDGAAEYDAVTTVTWDEALIP